MARLSSVIAGAIAVSMLSASVNAHTNMAVPKVQWPENFYNGNSPMGRIQSSSFNLGQDYYGTKMVDAVMKNYKTLRQMVMKNINVTPINGITGSKECGVSITTGAKQPLPDAVEFDWGHPGPCEVWCDNTRIFYNNECQGNKVGKVPVDKAKCAGASLIQAMYVGTHVGNWEVYSNCAPIAGGTKTDPATVFNADAAGDGAAGEADDDDDDEATPAPAATTKAPTNAPVPAVTTSAPKTNAPAPATNAPAPAATPSSSPSKSCTRRLRRD